MALKALKYNKLILEEFPNVTWPPGSQHTIFIDESVGEVTLGNNVRIEPFTILRGPITVGSDSTLGPFLEMTNSSCGSACKLQGTIEHSKLGNFVTVHPYTRLDRVLCGHNCAFGGEVRRSTLGNNVKAVHCSYLGDAVVADGVNIGASVITANFDGDAKKQTWIGEDSFIGVAVSLIARLPALIIGKNVMIGADCVVTEDIEDDTFVRQRCTLEKKPNLLQKIGKKWIR